MKFGHKYSIFMNALFLNLKKKSKNKIKTQLSIMLKNGQTYFGNVAMFEMVKSEVKWLKDEKILKIKN